MTRRRTESPATDAAVALLCEFVRQGVRDIVLSPGSRSQALALAAAELELIGAVRLHVRIDERVGGFLALGLAVETQTPVLLICTSGTGVANLHPAVLEAHHSGVPLIVLSADRPEELRGIGSNQTTQQAHLFGFAARLSLDVPAPAGAPGEIEAAEQLARDALAAASGPVQLNLSFREPLSAPVTLSSAPDAGSLPEPVEGSRGAPRLVPSTGPGTDILRTVVIAGTGAGARAEEFARQLGAPLLAEISSGAHFGPNLVVAYRELLNDPDFGGQVQRAIVFGHPTLSREVPALIERNGVETIVVRGRGGEDYNPGHRVAAFADEVVPDAAPADERWLRSWVAASRSRLEPGQDIAPDPAAPAGVHARRELAAVRAAVTRRSLVEAVWRATWPQDRLVLGASRLIRVADAVLPGKAVPVHANRGLAGIDGTIATGIGIALAAQADGARGTTRVLLGDLALLHDVGALAFGAGETRPRIQVIVGNDGGGTIFDDLEVAAAAGPGFDRVMLTPQSVQLEPLAAAYGWEYRRVENRGGLDQALTASGTPTLVEVPLSR